MRYEDEEDLIQIEEDGAVPNETVEMCLLGRLWIDKPYNTYGLIETMKKLWCPTKSIICREMGNNMISFRFRSKRDMDKVLAMEP